MSIEPRDGGADVDAVYRAGMSGNHPRPYLTAEDLKAVSDRCRVGGKFIRNIEAFEIDGPFDVPRLDLSLYGENTVQRSRPWAERVANSNSFIEKLLADVATETNPIMFVICLEERLEAPSR